MCIYVERIQRMCICMYIERIQRIHVTRDEKEERKKQARSNKQTRQCNKKTALGGTRTHDTLYSRQSALPTELHVCMCIYVERMCICIYEFREYMCIYVERIQRMCICMYIERIQSTENYVKE